MWHLWSLVGGASYKTDVDSIRRVFHRISPRSVLRVDWKLQTAVKWHPTYVQILDKVLRRNTSIHAQTNHQSWVESYFKSASTNTTQNQPKLRMQTSMFQNHCPKPSIGDHCFVIGLVVEPITKQYLQKAWDRLTTMMDWSDRAWLPIYSLIYTTTLQLLWKTNNKDSGPS